MRCFVTFFLLSSITTYATNCGQGIMDQYFDRVWTHDNTGNSRTYFSPMNRDIRRQNYLKKLTSDLQKRTKNENISDDPKRT